MADWLEGFVSMKQHVLVRFGKWREIVEQALPENRALFCVITAMMRYAMSVAHGALGSAQERFRLLLRAHELLLDIVERHPSTDLAAGGHRDLITLPG